MILLNQLLILLWKSWKVRMRNPISTVMEAILPLILPILLICFYGTFELKRIEGHNEETQVKSRIDAPEELILDIPSKSESNYDQRIYYTPANKFIHELMERVSTYTNGRNAFRPIKTPEELNAKLDSFDLSQLEYDYYLEIYGVIFDENALYDGRLIYSLRVFKDMRLILNRPFPFKFNKEEEGDSIYLSSFCRLQTLLNNAFVSLIFEKHYKYNTVVRLESHRFPYPKTSLKSSGYNFIDFVGPTLALGFTVLCPLLVKRITDEKAAKAKELLKMIGLSDWVFWGSHFLSYFLLMFIQCIIFTLLFCIGWKTPIIEKTSFLVVFLIFMIYCVQTILFCMTLTTIFNRPVLAIIVTVILWILSIAPYFFLHHFFKPELNIIQTNKYRIMSSFLPNMGLFWALSLISQMESESSGYNLLNIFSETSNYGYMSLGLVLLTMGISFLVYGFLVWYLDNVWPFQNGVPKHILFPLFPSYWCPKCYAKKNSKSLKASKEESNFEIEPKGEVTIKVENLTKTFGGFGFGRGKTVVNNISLSIYDKQITALLGHNGAGKTTTMNMITGMFPPNSGTVLINGYDIQYQTSEARKSIGLCPQENIIYNDLTVEEHLKLFAVIKGQSFKSVGVEVKNSIEFLKLKDKTHVKANKLSGGMKRRLALGIAMVGSTRIMILDEPTTGLDPEARRNIWDLLLRLKNERTILLTTHFMEEADVLGDRIAIMYEGSIRCCGSPMFLKKRFGAGYHLKVAKDKDFNKQLMEQTLKSYLPKAHLHSQIQTEVVYALESEKSTEVFPKLFDEIEKNKTSLGISSCGLSITTMEDVFIRVGNEFEGIHEKIDITPNQMKNKPSMVNKWTNYYTGFKLVFTQFYALLLKRFHFARRYLPMMIFQVILPGLLFMFALYCDNFIKSADEGLKKMDLDLYELYGNTFGFVKSNVSTDLVNSYVSNAKTHEMEATTLGPYEDPNKWALSKSENVDYFRKYLIGAEFEEIGSEIKGKVWYNNEALHTLPLSINIFYESLLKDLLPNRKHERLISVENYPVPRTNSAYTELIKLVASWAATCLLLIPITVPFLGASYVLYPINERESKAKLLQLMTGLSTTIFWLSNFVFDLITHSIFVVFVLILFAIFDTNKVFFSTTSTAICLFLLLFLFGFSSIALDYCFSFLFSKPSTGFATLVVIYVSFGLICVLVMGVLDFLIHNGLVAKIFISDTTFRILVGILDVMPVFSMGFGMQKLYRLASFAEVCTRLEKKASVALFLTCLELGNKGHLLYGCCTFRCQPHNECYTNKNPFAFDGYGIGTELVFLIGSGVVFLSLLIFFESEFFRTYNRNRLLYKSYLAHSVLKHSDNTTEDSDVIQEINRIEGLREEQKLSEEAMAVLSLTKYFGSLTAVDHLTFGVHKEECFGLLGVNGAGKTTVFSMLTGDITLSFGNAFIGNHSLKDNLKSYQKQIGYCPQFDALLEKLTGYETLYLFARLRGTPSGLIKSEVQSLIEMVDLQNHANKCTETYSGGNRRKLSLALAIVGSPSVLFLDEPTSGVDPIARRKIWSTLIYIQEVYHSAIVLTSHSMDECEALCSRIAIMVNGKFQCLGSTQQLRNKFGQGFTIVIKLKREAGNDSIQLQNYIKNSIPSAVLKDFHQGLLHFHITDSFVLWSYMFSVMERAKHNFPIEDYFISDTTLEQIFLTFAKTQQITNQLI